MRKPSARPRQFLNRRGAILTKLSCLAAISRFRWMERDSFIVAFFHLCRISGKVENSAEYTRGRIRFQPNNADVYQPAALHGKNGEQQANFSAAALPGHPRKQKALSKAGVFALMKRSAASLSEEEALTIRDLPNANTAARR